VGWGAVDAAGVTAALAERLVAPVATTLQGLSAFPADHPLHTGMGFGAAAVPAARKAFADCDCLLAVGVRFAELATGSYSLPVPETLIHVDINAEVFNKNYPAALAVQGDAGQVMACIAEELERREWQSPRDPKVLTDTIQSEKQAYRAQWTSKPNASLVSPGSFFQALRQRTPEDAIAVVTTEAHLQPLSFSVLRPRHFISPPISTVWAIVFRRPSGPGWATRIRSSLPSWRWRLPDDRYGTADRRHVWCWAGRLRLSRWRTRPDFGISEPAAESNVHRARRCELLRALPSLLALTFWR
jgi:hypothetical protein